MTLITIDMKWVAEPLPGMLMVTGRYGHKP